MAQSAKPLELWLIRHGETEWSLSGAHTSRSDIPLTPRGAQCAALLGHALAGTEFSQVLVSPRLRARETCRIAGLGDVAQVEENLAEWDYGKDEGRTTAEIRAERPGWSIWTQGPLDGETAEHVAQRARAVIERAAGIGGRVALFSHAHFLRIFAATWLEQPAAFGSRLVLGTGSLSMLGYERETRVITTWNHSFECD